LYEKTIPHQFCPGIGHFFGYDRLQNDFHVLQLKMLLP
jgi:hypothetical protein